MVGGALVCDPDGMTAPRTARALARETLTREILAAARARLVAGGPAARLGPAAHARAREAELAATP